MISQILLRFWTILSTASVLHAQSELRASKSDSSPKAFDIRGHGATGDGLTLDSPAIQTALDAAATASGSQVRFPPGRYLSGTIHLRSRVTLSIEAGATLVGTTNLNHYRHPAVPDFLPEAKWGKWHRGLILGENVEDVTITGPGVIDGNRVFDPTGEERMRGPHTIVFVNCRRFTLRDLTIVDSANYAVFFQLSDNVDFRNLKIIGGWDGIHWRGAPDRWCRNVNIVGCQFQTGDDAIAGRYWDNTLITGCTINSSCNGIRLIGPATRLIVHNNLFYGPGLRPHLTSRERQRTNMLSGIILQPGAWDATRGPLDDVLLSNNTLQHVASPVTLWIKPGNTAGRVTVTGLNATGVYRSALSVESWAETPVTSVVIRNAQIEFTGGGTAAQAKQPVKGPGVDARPLPAWGIYARNVERLTLEDVRLSLVQDDFRPVVLADAVRQVRFDNVRFPRVPGVANPLVATNGSQFIHVSATKGDPGATAPAGTTGSADAAR
ncbi:MAG: right-handed parallel beta-helix repeat-containing protein [Verrucomicrobia bacterium]|nr:right-handed parallel beta-helix repeat-containing protein [Verrucomicrobiota bacterium]